MVSLIILIILAVIAVIGYIIYLNLPSTKFNKANRLLNQNRLTEAQELYNQIILKHPLAVARYAECFFLKGEELKKQNKTNKAIEYYIKTIAAKTLLKPNSKKDSFSKIAAKAFYEIAVIRYNNISNVYNIDAIQALKKNLNNIKKAEYKDKQKLEELTTKHKLEIADIYYELGIEEESKQNIIAAKNNYSNTINTLKEISQNQKYFNAIGRNEICKLKLNEKIDSENFEFISRASEPIQTDYYFRQSVCLIKHNNFSEAETIIDEKLNNESGVIQFLKEICSNEKIKSAITEITHINSQIKELYIESSLIDDVLLLFNSINKKAKYLNQIIPNSGNELEKLKPSLFNRILQAYNDRNEYGNAINLIKKYPEYYKSPALMKNMGNSCINYLNTHTLTDKNYKLFIALFLTSAYSDDVMLYSLEETQWDDDYTFSLQDSIGSSYELHTQLPDNVNYDDITQTSISIGESQRFLISQFETLLNEQEVDSSLLKEIYDFYDAEKNAIESIISIIPNDIIFATPYFAKQFKIANAIIDELEYDYTEYGNEESLEAGITYLFDNRDLQIRGYKDAKRTIEKLIESIKNNDINQFNKCLTNGQKDLLYKFGSLSESIEIKLVEAFNTKIKQSKESESLLELMKAARKISPTKETLNYQYANYASSYCVSRINAEKMTNYTGLQIMNNAYKLLPNDARVCTNIIALIRLNIFDILNGRNNNSSAIFSILDEIKNNRSNTFKSNTGELIKARNEILKQLPIDARVTITSGINLNSQGRQLKKVLDYLGSLGGSSAIKDPLTSLREQLGLNFDLPI